MLPHKLLKALLKKFILRVIDDVKLLFFRVLNYDVCSQW